jgi:DNA adenine methylase
MPVSAQSKSMSPPLKWAGGKRWQVAHLLPLWKPHAKRRLVEPFAGGLAVTLGLSPERALLNDVNPHLVNFYRWLKKGLVINLEMANDEDLFYRHRDRFNDLVKHGHGDSADSAALFYYLNRTGYNGLCRFNAKGGFNVPFGSYKTITYTRDFTAYRDVFEDWHFTLGDFEAIPLEPGDFVYADPPYDVDFTAYSRGGFSWDDQVRTAEWLAKHKGPVILVNQATDRIEELYRKLGYDVRFLQARRNINSKGSGRKPVNEILGTRNL